MSSYTFDLITALCAGALIGYFIRRRQTLYWRSVARMLSSVAIFQTHLVATLERARSIYEAFGPVEAWQFVIAEVEAYQAPYGTDALDPESARPHGDN